MLASILKSERAEKVNMHIIDTFIKLRQILFVKKDIVNQLEQIQTKLIKHDNQITIVFNYIRALEKHKQEKTNFKNRKKIGFKREKK